MQDGEVVIGTVTADTSAVGEGNEIIVDVISGEPEDPTESRVVDITLRDTNGQNQQPQGNVEICLSVSQTSSDQCLAVFNEEENIWECEDPCLSTSDSLLCGETSHFSRFSILLDPTGKGSEDCDSDSWNGITGAQWSDYVVILSVTCFFCCVAWTFAFLVTIMFPSVHGEEHSRLVSLRSHSRRSETFHK